MLKCRYPIKLFVTLITIGLLLYALRFVGPAAEFYAGALIIIICAPGFLIGMMLSAGLSLRSLKDQAEKSILDAYSTEFGLNVVGLILVCLFAVKFLDR